MTQEYLIAYGSDLIGLADAVRHELDRGWKAQGGIAVGVDMFYQALTRDTVNPNGEELVATR